MTTENTDKGQTPTEADGQGHCALGDGSEQNKKPRCWLCETPLSASQVDGDYCEMCWDNIESWI